MHPALEAIRNVTNGTAYENHLWLVGGAVRDEILGIQSSQDFDIVTTLDAVEAAHLLRELGVAEIDPVLYPRFGTALVRVLGVNVELVTARRESYEEWSRKPKVQPATLVEDAKRRDFTVNTLLRNLHTQELHDPLGVGLSDLEDRVLRTPVDPVTTFHDDPLRMLRAIRLKWQLQFRLDPQAWDAIKACKDRLRIISAERIQDELVRMLSLPSAHSALRDLMERGLLHEFLPELSKLKMVEQGSYHHLDVWEHTLLAVQNANSSDVILNLALLLHDIAKPLCKTVSDEGHVHFYHHDRLGALESEKILRRLKFPNEIVEPVCLLIRHHMRIGSAGNFSASAARRLLRDLGDQTDRLLDLVKADSDAHHPEMQPKVNVEDVRIKIQNVCRETPISQLRSPLNGHEVMATLHLEAGPEVGAAQAWLLDLVLDGKLHSDDKEGARRLLLETYFPAPS